MPYNVEWSKTSLRQLKKLDKMLADRIIKKVEAINSNPFNFVEKLQGFELYKLRIGDYRAILSIQNQKMVIFVLEVDRRSVI